VWWCSSKAGYVLLQRNPRQNLLGEKSLSDPIAGCSYLVLEIFPLLGISDDRSRHQEALLDF